MAKYTNEIIDKSTELQEIWVTEDNDPSTRRLVYSIDKSKKEIIFYPKQNDFYISSITLKGFDDLPDEFSQNGYIKQGVQYYLNKKLEGSKVVALIISKDDENNIKKKKGDDKYLMTLKYGELKILREKYLTINQESAKTKSDTIDEFFHNLFPTHFSENKTSSKDQYNKVLKNLSKDIIEHFTKEDLVKFEGFIIDLLDNKYSAKNFKFTQLARTKLQIDTVAIDRILLEFDENLKKKVSEKKWGEFLVKYLYLLDSKYIKTFPEINLILGGERRADFGMIDTKGFLDIFEIKTPDTDLLAKTTDRGNYYWSTDAIKAIVQAEKYLFRAERKASTLAEDLARENNVKIQVIKPRAFLIIGHSSELVNESQKEDFRILSQSLKNISILTYDGLLEGLENQKNKYIDEITGKNDES